MFLPGKSHGQGSLAGYSPWGHKESDTTGQLHLNVSSTVKTMNSQIEFLHDVLVRDLISLLATPFQ